MDESPLTHFDSSGASRMVDVADKPTTLRTARAVAEMTLKPDTLSAIQNREISKGDVFEVARLAGIMAAKQTPALIPLCHLLPLEAVEIRFEAPSDRQLRIESMVRVTARTGVEMEALTAVTVAALTVYDMCKSMDREMMIGPMFLLEKSGGRSGDFRREVSPPDHPPKVS